MNLDFDFFGLAASGFVRFEVALARDSLHLGWVGRFKHQEFNVDSSSLED
jgi:hypothetical protein